MESHSVWIHATWWCQVWKSHVNMCLKKPLTNFWIFYRQFRDTHYFIIHTNWTVWLANKNLSDMHHCTNCILPDFTQQYLLEAFDVIQPAFNNPFQSYYTSYLPGVFELYSRPFSQSVSLISYLWWWHILAFGREVGYQFINSGLDYTPGLYMDSCNPIIYTVLDNKICKMGLTQGRPLNTSAEQEES